MDDRRGVGGDNGADRTGGGGRLVADEAVSRGNRRHRVIEAGWGAVAAAYVENDGNISKVAADGAQLGEFWNEAWGQIVDAEIAQVLQTFGSLAFAGTRQARDDDEMNARRGCRLR